MLVYIILILKYKKITSKKTKNYLKYKFYKVYFFYCD